MSRYRPTIMSGRTEPRDKRKLKFVGTWKLVKHEPVTTSALYVALKLDRAGSYVKMPVTVQVKTIEPVSVAFVYLQWHGIT